MEVRGQRHAPAAISPGISPGTYRIGGLVDSRFCLDVLENKKICYPYQDMQFLQKLYCNNSVYLAHFVYVYMYI